MGDVTLYESANYGGRKVSIKEKTDDLTGLLPKGASSMTIPRDTKEWHVFTDVSYLGDTKVLQAGRSYGNVACMGLESPVKSMRPAEPPK